MNTFTAWVIGFPLGCLIGAGLCYAVDRIIMIWEARKWHD